MPPARVARNPYNLVGEAKPCSTDQDASSVPKMASVRPKVLRFSGSASVLAATRKIKKYAAACNPAAMVPWLYTAACRRICRVTTPASAAHGQRSGTQLDGNFWRELLNQNAASVAAPSS